MKKKVHVPQAYEDCILEHGAPSKVMIDNAKEHLSTTFHSVSQR